eukprot:CAMPEP_0181195254 /NCGR_PEP_ID=MMETSP1096-20121128/14782_1 /TAXON_ID=156174 ORGANISM="Chrysochromulina ericina, Strain CCMP281" /NCGR_SAMPLE_ID=MMETSP1096 /ASSEMBLY_ACC=CAM_ASM_000453 /LENGTH=68 /DNA_ID=CAMNT_0023284831 /DNA_START=130 /DNA_END=336 /DNA_ORIENTATION=+
MILFGSALIPAGWYPGWALTSILQDGSRDMLQGVRLAFGAWGGGGAADVHAHVAHAHVAHAHGRTLHH